MQVSGYEDEYKKIFYFRGLLSEFEVNTCSLIQEVLFLLLHISDTDCDQNMTICAHLTVNATCFYKTVIFRIVNMICNLQFFTS